MPCRLMNFTYGNHLRISEKTPVKTPRRLMDFTYGNHLRIRKNFIGVQHKFVLLSNNRLKLLNHSESILFHYFHGFLGKFIYYQKNNTLTFRIMRPSFHFQEFDAFYSWEKTPQKLFYLMFQNSNEKVRNLYSIFQIRSKFLSTFEFLFWSVKHEI